MAYMVSGDRKAPIDFGPPDAISEILQNIRMILTTPVFSVPLDRDFGIDFTLLDNPQPMAMAKLSDQIFQAIRKFEPRAEIIEIDYLHDAGDLIDGKIVPRVRIGEVDI